MRRFKQAHALPHDWAALVLDLRKYHHAHNAPEKTERGQQALAALTQLIDDYGDELRDAIALVSQADGAINASRSQQISQYHRNRIGKLEKSIDAIDQALASEAESHDALALAELNSQRQHLVYQLKDHGEKIDQRGHGLYLSKMRRKHR